MKMIAHEFHVKFSLMKFMQLLFLVELYLERACARTLGEHHIKYSQCIALSLLSDC